MVSFPHTLKILTCLHIYLLPYLLTHSMMQSPSSEANWFASSQEVPRNSRNQKVHYRTHKCSPPGCILGQPNPAHIPVSHLQEILHNIIHPSTPKSPQWFPSLWFLQQDPIHPLSSSIRAALYIYRVSQEKCARLRESVPYVKVYRYNPKHLYPKLNGYGDNGQRSLKL